MQSVPETKQDRSDEVTQGAQPATAEPRRFESRHEGRFHDRPIVYEVIASDTHLSDATGRPRASLSSFAYLAAGDIDPARRAITFLFNGGPGSASLWLHMGAFGPQRIVVPGDGTFPGGPPYRLEDNHLCCLDVTDLVFIDPIGTGYSRALGEAKTEDYWGLDADAEITGEFIKRFLSDHHRWASPRYLVGESYGTTRAVAVATKLNSAVGAVTFNGLALISVILDFHTVRFEKGNILADVGILPTYAATALHHGRVTPTPASREEFLDEVRRFALDDYAPALLAGSRLDPGRRQKLIDRLSHFTGLDKDWLSRARLRIEPSRFRKELLRDRGLTVGRFDTRYVGADYDDVGEVPDEDPAAYAIKSAYTTAMQDYLGRRLGVDSAVPYVAFTNEAWKKWKWDLPEDKDFPHWPGYVNLAPDLGRLQRENLSLRVLMANGLYDLATPFFSAENTIANNGIDSARITMRYYDAGHMMYVNDNCLSQLVGDFRELLGVTG